MKLSAVDRENIEVLEALDIDENALFLLLCRYFAYRGRRFDGRHGNTPNQAIENTLRWSMQEARRRAEWQKEHP